ncbi:HEAT repeat domain-containing protein [Natronomonas sp.]|uniref:HEAT repeat domain-containing protein n=1 Tax=Natronomonas sp. TaxID=2184060 RepID=UPI00262395C9|nr:HEAT repeat domain-containing protein [Natronomonas sp.]
MSPGETDAETWLDRLEDAEYSDSEGEIHPSVLDPPIDAADIPDLRRLLRHGGSETVKRRAAEALGALAHTAAAYDTAAVTDELTRAVLANASAGVRAEAIASLSAHGDEHVDRLVELIAAAVGRTDGTGPAEFFTRWLSAEFPEFRMVAATALGDLTADRAIDRLEDAFRDPDPRVRTRAIEAYARFGDRADAGAIEPMLDAADSAVRLAAASALATIGTEPALEALLSVTTADDDRLRRIAVGELYRLDSRRAAAALAEAVRGRSATVRRRAVVSLVRLYANGESVRPRTARDLLLEGSEPSALAAVAETLSSALEDADGPASAPTVQREIVWLLGETADAAPSPSPEVRCRLVDALATPSPAGDIAAAYLRRFEGETLEAELRSMSRNRDAPAAARERAEAVLERIKRATATATEERSVEYTYVRRPSDYTDEHGD